MQKLKSFFSLVLSIAMLLSIIPITSVATQSQASPNPSVSLIASDVVRVCEKTGSMKNGSAIVKATPSGVPEITGAYTAEAYSGETPVYPQITFNSDRDVSDVTITCTNNDTVILETSKPSDNTYVWSVIGGNAEPGSFLDFRVNYTYGGNVYTALTSAYVEGIIQPAGVYTDSYRTSVTSYNCNADYVYRILGKNTYGSYFDPKDSSTGKGDDFEQDATVWSHGYFDFVSMTPKSWGTTADAAKGCGLVLWGIENGSAHRYGNMGLDKERPVSTTYIDASQSPALNSESINLRYAVTDLNYGYKDDGYTRSLTADTVILPGEASWSSESVNNEAASTQLGFGAIGNEVFFRQDEAFIPQSPYRISDYALSIPFNGTSYADAMTTLEDGTKEIYYTLVTTLYSMASQGKREIFNHSATNIHLVMYDKSQLKALVDNATELLEADCTSVISTDSADTPGWYSFEAALIEAQHTLAKPNLCQADLDSAAAELSDKTEKLGKEFWIEAKAADVTDTNAIVEVTLLGEAQKIRFVNSANETLTLTPESKRVISVDNMGDGAYKWSIELQLYKDSEEYSIYAKFADTGWNHQCANLTVSKKPQDLKVYSLSIPEAVDSVVYQGVNEVVFVTGIDVSKIQLKKGENTLTYSDPSLYSVENGKLIWKINVNFCDLGDNSYTVRVRSTKTSFEAVRVLDILVYSK